MLFFRQQTSNSCHVIALQTALSFFELFPSPREIRQALPRHTFGNLITELGIFLERTHIKTEIVSDKASVQSNTQLLDITLQRYWEMGKYSNRLITPADFDNGPVIVNVNWHKARGDVKGYLSHYIVVLKENGKLWLYDGSNYDKPIQTNFDSVLSMSREINRKKDDGMFLVCYR